jgi:hypothetical protein
MHRRRLLTVLTLGTAATGLLAACGAPAAPATPTAAPAAPAAKAPAKPVATGMVFPIYAGATPLAADNPMTPAIDAMKQQLKQQPDANVVVDAYALPGGATFDQVKTFYTNELTSKGWKGVDASQAGANLPGGGAAAWIKDDNQVLTVMMMAVPAQAGAPVLIVAHGTKK